MDKLHPIIINSKPAKRHLDTVRAQHSSILNDLQNHTLKVQQYNMQKDIEKQQKDMMDAENNRQNKEFEATQNKEFADRQATQQKESADRDMKLKEIEVKKMALTMPSTP